MYIKKVPQIIIGGWKSIHVASAQELGIDLYALPHFPLLIVWYQGLCKLGVDLESSDSL